MSEIKSDIDIVAEANKGDATAFAELLARHYDLIYRVAFRSIGNQQDAEDIAQDVCVALPKKLASFQGRSKLTTWLYQITLNQCRDLMRKNSCSQKTQSDYIDVHEMNQIENEQRRKTVEWAYNAIDYLTEPLRETALLVVAEGLNHAETAEILGIKESTVSWRMMEVKKKLKAREKVEASE
ncbi:MAG TPA: RNA polymerase sigma factor [Leucothrix sp.]|nr:RNA polymerase sigma factor [Leucothrix sp.]